MHFNPHLLAEGSQVLQVSSDYFVAKIYSFDQDRVSVPIFKQLKRHEV
mgnify:CR=1